MALTEPMNASTDAPLYLPFTIPVNLPGLVSSEPSDCPQLPLPQKSIPPQTLGYTDIGPERIGTDFGMETAFKFVPDDYVCIKDVTLVVRLAQLAAAGGGNNPRYPADAILHAMEKCDISVGGLILQTLRGDPLHFKEEAESSTEEYARLDLGQKISLDIPDRVTAALAAQTFYVKLPFFFTETAAKNWHQYAFQRNTRINIKWRAPESILQQSVVNARPTPVGSTTYIQDIFIRLSVVALDTTVKDTYVNAVKNLGESGLNYLLRYEQLQEGFTLAAGQNTANVPMTNFNKPTYMIRSVVRTAANLLPSYLNNERWAIEDYNTVQETASGHNLAGPYTSQWVQFGINGVEFMGNAQSNIIHILHTDYPDVSQYPMGCIEYAKLQNPILTIVCPAPPVAHDRQVDIWAYCFNYIRCVIDQQNKSAVALEQPL